MSIRSVATVRAALQVHRWLGLGLAAFVAMFALTGIALCFRAEIERHVTSAELWADDVEHRELDFVRLVDAVRAQRPEAVDVAVRAPELPYTVPRARYGLPDPVTGARRDTIAAIDPVDGRIRGEYRGGQLPIDRHNLMSVIAKFHYSLLAGRTGEIVLGFCGIFLVLSVLIGAFVWWPNRRALRASLTFDLRWPRRRLEPAFHRAAGAWTATMLLVIGTTGAIMLFPDQVLGWFGSAPPNSASAALRAAPAGRPHVDGATNALVAGAYPGARVNQVRAPQEPGGPYVLVLTRPGDLSPHGRTSVALHLPEGRLVPDTERENERAGDTLLALAYTLHTADFAGIAGRTFVALTGVVLALLLYTGCSGWWRRTAARRRANAAASAVGA